MSAKHTPGPWHTVNSGSAVVGNIAEIEKSFVASVYGRDGGVDDRCPTLQANARLIAAAPELLREAEWCVALLKSRSLNEDEQAVLDAMIAAIAKATGAA